MSEEREKEERGLSRQINRAIPYHRPTVRRAGIDGLGELLEPSIDLTNPRSSVAVQSGQNLSMNLPTSSEVRGFTAQVHVTSASVLLLPADPARKFLFLQNNDALGSCTASFGCDAVLGVGIRLAAGGGGILLDNNVPTSALYIIGSIASNPNVTLISG